MNNRGPLHNFTRKSHMISIDKSYVCGMIIGWECMITEKEINPQPSVIAVGFHLSSDLTHMPCFRRRNPWFTWSSLTTLPGMFPNWRWPSRMLSSSSLCRFLKGAVKRLAMCYCFFDSGLPQEEWELERTVFQFSVHKAC